ncbi:MAG: 50S ribosomal protein L22 [Anaerolineae bacterium SM23_ 63]|nr:MAG: 50S ribosomal protein L22 [Anaerolineae bacterium SM23_ 63]HEY45833.1 50S ribosomal protein L22 [Anaerolineae bacterium]
MEQAFDIHASVRYVRMSPQKVRLVLDMVRGLDVMEALDILRFTQKSAANTVLKLLNSAIANAEENFGLNRDDLVVHRIYADQGPIRRWRRFGARGRFKPIQRRYSHITVILREREEEES